MGNAEPWITPSPSASARVPYRSKMLQAITCLRAGFVRITVLEK
jgi:hypothetical protein